MGFISFGLEPAKAPGKDSSDWDKKYYTAKEKAENALIPLLGVISFIVFGVFMVVKKSGWWAWIFVAVGAIGAVYLLTDLIPAANELNALRKLKKIKGKTLSVDDDFENFEKSQDEKGKEESSEVKDEFEVEDTYEIKTLNTKKKKKK